MICLPDARYARELAEPLLDSLPRGALVIDPWNALAPVLAAPFAARNIALEVFGRGDLGSHAGVPR